MKFRNKKLSATFIIATVLLSMTFLFQPVEVIGEDFDTTEGTNNLIYDLSNNQLNDYGDSKTIVNRSGKGYQMTTFENDIQMISEDGWKPIDPTLILNKEGEFISKDIELEVSFSEDLEIKEPFIKVKSNENNVEYTLVGFETKNGFIPVKRSNGEVSDNQITYPEVISGVDLRHIILNNEVKEDLILNKKIHGLESIHYELKTDLTPYIDEETGALVLENNKGHKIYEMPAPHMTDSEIKNGSGYSENNYDLKYKLVKNKDHYDLSVVVLSDWLDQERIYPVYIDPTLIKNSSSDTFISSAAPDKGHNQYWNSALGQYVLRVGKYDSSTGTNYGLVKLSSVESLKGAIINSAHLKTFVNWSYYETTKTGVWVDKITSQWSENNATWNTRPSSTGVGSTTVARNSWATFDVTNATKEVVTGKRVDFGFKFHTNGHEMTHWKQLSAGENGKNVTHLTVDYTYPQMQPATINAYPTSSTNSTTGYINVSWPSVNGATAYRLQMHDGKGWQTIYNGTNTTYSTQNKKIWPLTSQYSTRDSVSGGIKFRTGDGQELPADPSSFFSSSNSAPTSVTNYSFRVIADYNLGSSPISEVRKTTLLNIIPDTPSTPTLDGVGILSEKEGWFNISWEAVKGALSYDILIFNGYAYERFDVGNVNWWSSQNKKMYPTENQLSNVAYQSRTTFKNDATGTDFALDPRPLYQKTGDKYHQTPYYFVKVIAKSSKGESAASEALKVWMPTSSPEVSSTIQYDENSETNSEINLNWDSVKDAQGYLVYAFNGNEYKFIERLNKENISWTSKEKYIWPKNESGDFLKEGGNLFPLNPKSLYSTKTLEENFKFKVFAYKGIDSSKSETDMGRYLGISNSNEIELEPLPSLDFLPKHLERVDNSTSKMKKVNVNLIEGEANNTILNLKWDPVVGNQGYKLLIFDGEKDFEIDIPKTVTEWSTEGQGIFPTLDQIENGKNHFLVDKTGGEFSVDPSYFYASKPDVNEHMLTYFSNKYIVRIVSKTANGYSPVSFAKIIQPQIIEDETIRMSDELTTESIVNAEKSLEVKGFKAEEIEDMSDELKIIIDAEGGLPVNVVDSEYIYSTSSVDMYNNPVKELEFVGDSVEEINEQIERYNVDSMDNASNISTMSKMSTNSLTTQSYDTSPFNKTWDIVPNNSWKGKSYIVYKGTRNGNFVYDFYTEFQWNHKPSVSYVVDEFGFYLGLDGRKNSAKRYSNVKVTSLQNKIYQTGMAYNPTTNTQQVSFKFNWRRTPENIAYKTVNGFSRIEVIYPHRDKGVPVNFASYYRHPWGIPSGSVGVKGVSLNFPKLGSNWYWEKFFYVGERR